MTWQEILVSALAPNQLYGHASYVLLIASMLMRDIVWLRILAIFSGIVALYYRSFVNYDPVSIFWEALFVLANLGQLVILYIERHRARFSEEELLFIKAALPGIDKALAARLMKRGQWQEVPAGTVLTTMGQMVPQLMFIASGLVTISRDDKMVGACGQGDFLGEISVMGNRPATATSTAAKPVRFLGFEREALASLLRQNPELRHAMEASFNRNLIDKLTRLNEGGSSGADRLQPQ